MAQDDRYAFDRERLEELDTDVFVIRDTQSGRRVCLCPENDMAELVTEALNEHDDDELSELSTWLRGS